MKKYRLTKITVKTREVISLSKTPAHETQNSLCPLCHSPLPTSLPAPEGSAGLIKIAKQPAELPPAGRMDEQTQEINKEIYK